MKQGPEGPSVKGPCKAQVCTQIYLCPTFEQNWFCIFSKVILLYYFSILKDTDWLELDVDIVFHKVIWVIFVYLDGICVWVIFVHLGIFGFVLVPFIAQSNSQCIYIPFLIINKYTLKSVQEAVRLPSLTGENVTMTIHRRPLEG